MKYSALLKQIDDLEAKVVGQKHREHLSIVVNEGEDPKLAMERALAEWAAKHPRAKPRGIDDFSWLVWTVAKWVSGPVCPIPGAASSGNFDVFADEVAEKARKRFGRRLVYPPVGVV
jgi:hypothetical protein